MNTTTFTRYENGNVSSFTVTDGSNVIIDGNIYHNVHSIIIKSKLKEDICLNNVKINNITIQGGCQNIEANNLKIQVNDGDVGNISSKGNGQVSVVSNNVKSIISQNGSINIKGNVSENVYNTNGSININGTVSGDVKSQHGSINTKNNSYIGHQVNSGGTVTMNF